VFEKKNGQDGCKCGACGGEVMTPRQRMARMRKLMAQERKTGVLEPWFLYFTDPDAPAGQRFLGACIVEARGLITAVDRAHKLGINPGGQVLAYDTPEHDPSLRNRLITDDTEMATLGYKRKAVGA